MENRNSCAGRSGLRVQSFGFAAPPAAKRFVREDLEKVRQDLLAEIRQTRQELSGRVMARHAGGRQPD